MQTLRFTTLLAVTLLTSAAQARLLETIQQCDTRYGTGQDVQLELGAGFKSEQGKTWSAKAYSARGLTIQIVFEDGAAVLVRYSNEPPLKMANSISRPVHLTVDEVTHLRGLNLAEGVVWESHKDRTLESLSSNMTLWISSDKLRYAAYDRENRQLFICSAKFWEIVAENLRNQAESSPAIRLNGL